MNKNGSSVAEEPKVSVTEKSNALEDGKIMEDEKMEGASEKSPHGILAAVDESRSSKIENSHPMAESEVDGIGPEASLVGIEPEDS
ncbi:hypothetical protein GH714_002439 [Hevea brasiliensis]|uniref:Uncharacterized protein n=1 Tax=Hevea brasiliensis TaxID=3981 RepID=A0A6A6KJW5_HEVBR|nr:hypothetical protein GH714_002439 [Hevea brasiliensis]